MNSRRLFVKKALGFVGLGLVAPSILSLPVSAAEERRRAKPTEGGAAGGAKSDTDLPLVEPGKGMAAGVNYANSHKDIKDAKLKTERQGVPFEKQYCNACMLYTKAGMKGGAEVGKCTLFAGQLVKGDAWCASWSKKA